MPIVNSDNPISSNWTVRTIDKPAAQPLLISVAEAAARVGLSRGGVYSLIQAGQFPHKRVGGRLLVPVQALEEWANKP